MTKVKPLMKKMIGKAHKNSILQNFEKKISIKVWLFLTWRKGSFIFHNLLKIDDYSNARNVE